MGATKKSANVRDPKVTRTKRVRKLRIDESGEEKKCFICGARSSISRKAGTPTVQTVISARIASSGESGLTR